ncbi:MAG: 16S rRNA (uracil(1498)-N(3))-methyltransferase, partial [Lachnospiraceae bacterium]|nr:16S rRNA (uracil(1498)-N(3))-methyltransferase [Lachnospiraceae bacterium]
MYSFFVEDSRIADKTAWIGGEDMRHIRNVLRMREGDKLRISNGKDRCFVCRIDAFEEEQIRLVLLEEDPEGTELASRICLFQCLPKGDKMEWVIQKNTELGVAEVIPVASKRAVVKLDAKKAKAKVERWQAIAKSAAEQSKRTVVPTVQPVMSFKEALAYAKELDLLVIPYENAEGMAATKAWLASVKPGLSIGILIGPEGGFEHEEVEQAMAMGWQPLTLGRRILRTETAGMA